jgi:hypothetical protein
MKIRQHVVSLIDWTIYILGHIADKLQPDDYDLPDFDRLNFEDEDSSRLHR